MRVVGVRVTGKNKTLYYYDNNLNLKPKLTVIVETDRGLQFATVVGYIDDSIKKINQELDMVVRIATKKDYLQHLNNLKDAKEAITKCQKLVLKYNLNMNIIDATYNFDRSQLLFRFVADDRVDFRDLARELGSIFKTRIELRQIGIRDKAQDIGGIGPCGRKLCCSAFLKDFEGVSINMAKNQSLALNPTKINGVCGRLLCCLAYENDNYNEYRKKMPNVGDLVKTKSGQGKVISVDLLKGTYKFTSNDNDVIEESVNSES